MKYIQCLLAGSMLLLTASVSRATERPATSAANLPSGWVWPPSPAMVDRGTRCRGELAAEGVQFKRVQRAVGQVMNPVVVPGGQFGSLQVKLVGSERPPIMDCELALALVREADGLTALGVRTLLIGRVVHERRARLGGRSVNLRSRHGLGLAIDIRAFVTQGGMRLTVLHDYERPLVQRVEAWLLSNETFRAVVTPANDAAHRDHFHLSAKLNLDPATPEPRVDLHQVLREAHAQELATRPRRTAALGAARRRRGLPHGS